MGVSDRLETCPNNTIIIANQDCVLTDYVFVGTGQGTCPPFVDNTANLYKITYLNRPSYE